jgi:hypothetical protein
VGIENKIERHIHQIFKAMIGVDEFMKLFLAVALLPAWIEAKLQINIEKQ